MKKLPFFLLLLVALVIALATVVEGRMGSEMAHRSIYGAWWFVALWGMVAAGGCWLMWRKKMWKRPSVFLLHVSFVVILLGALVTHLTSRRGFIHLREGEVTRHYLQRSDDGSVLNMKPMPFYLALDSFRVEYDEDGVTCSDYVSYVLMSDQDEKRHTTISMNNIGRSHGYRIYQTSYDDDGHGSVFTVNYDPWGTGITYAGYLLLAIGMGSLTLRPLKRRGNSFRRRGGGEAVRSVWAEVALFLVGVLLASYMVISIAFRPLMPILRSPLLFVHVGTIMISYILLVVSMLKRSLLRVAVFFLAAGIFLGAMWANVSWGTYWSWDPKESWAIITLIVYSLPLHEKSLPWFRSTRNYRIYCVLCILCLLMTYFGVNYLLGGMHSYAN